MTSLPEFDDVVIELLDRQPEADMVPTLRRVAAVMDLLGDPQRGPRVVQITGTNGKTSTARMIEAMLLASGLRVGTYTSPHLQSVTERIRVDGEPISTDRFVEAYEDLRPVLALVDRDSEAAGEPELTFFEVLTCLAFAVFADAPVDVAVVEVGLGGRWDATNVADAEVAVITPIALDHTDWLGTSVQQIAAEKAGIVKPGAIAVIAGQPTDVRPVLLARCREVGAEVRLLGDQVALTDRAVALGGQQVSVRGVEALYPDLFVPILGPHQAANAALALAAVEALLVHGQPLAESVVQALADARSPGRLEAVRRDPTVLLDAAHNPAGAAALAAALADSYRFDDVTAVVGVLADKDVPGILAALAGSVTRVIATQPASPRALPAAALAALAGEHVADVVEVPDLRQALAQARQVAAGRRGAVLVTGSVVTVGQAREILNREERS